MFEADDLHTRRIIEKGPGMRKLARDPAEIVPHCADDPLMVLTRQRSFQIAPGAARDRQARSDHTPDEAAQSRGRVHRQQTEPMIDQPQYARLKTVHHIAHKRGRSPSAGASTSSSAASCSQATSICTTPIWSRILGGTRTKSFPVDTRKAL